MKQGFPPVARKDARLFILGSLPGDRSLALQQYYGHKGNHFWRLVGMLIDQPLAEMDYAERLEKLADRRIGLWDVFAAARRDGSADAAIREGECNPLHRLAQEFPIVEAIAFNGAMAAREGRKNLGHSSFLTFDLPSSSGMAAIPFAAKLERWRVISAYIG